MIGCGEAWPEMRLRFQGNGRPCSLLLSADSADHDLVMRPRSVLQPGREKDEVHGLSEFYPALLFCSGLVVCTSGRPTG
jgi:hypothetical protein